MKSAASNRDLAINDERSCVATDAGFDRNQFIALLMSREKIKADNNDVFFICEGQHTLNSVVDCR